MLSKMKPSAELVPGAHAYSLINGLGLAHFDAHLRHHEAAAELLQGDLVSLLGNRGIKISLLA